MNPSKSFLIEQSYINLAIVETKEQQQKEKKLLDAKLSIEIIGTFEEIYGTKTNIEIKDIFEKCKDQTTKILVLGRAGIGKTTFCRYVAYQWATGAIWQEYDLVIFIQLRNLTETRYPPLAPGTSYSLVDLVKKEYFRQGLSEKDERLLKDQLDSSQVLWLFDGYDEIIQNVPAHLQYLFEQLLHTSHHILTSRPYLNTLSYDVKLEIIGFTDDNLKEYVKLFFTQLDDEIDNASLQGEKLLTFLKCNPRIWGIVHIPVNLELVCSLWCDTDWTETSTITMTTVYDRMTEWLCRRHLEKQDTSSRQIIKEEIYEHCHKELAFLESLAFNGMESNSIILRPKLLRTASKESECSLQHQPNLLNIGILKSLDYKPVGTDIEADKNHYFLHLSFQEHFAARYLVKALSGGTHQKRKAINFIKAHKYNQRFELVFTFASGLLNDSDCEESVKLFWEILLGEPLDLIGLRHIQIIISCIEETGCNRSLPRFSESIDLVIKWIRYSVYKKHIHQDYLLSVSLRRSPALINQPEIIDTFVKLHKHIDPTIQKYAYLLICDLPIWNSYSTHLYLAAVNNSNMQVRVSACNALGNLSEKVVTIEIIDGLITTLGDSDIDVRWAACEALGRVSKKVATSKITNRLVGALGNGNYFVRRGAYKILCKMCEHVANSEINNTLVSALDDTNHYVRFGACEVLGNMGEKTVTKESIDRLVIALGDTNVDVRISACTALRTIGETTATNAVINRLVSALDDINDIVRRGACKTLGEMGEKAVTDESINRLAIALGDINVDVRISACTALGKIGEKSANNVTIDGLVRALGDTDNIVRRSACEALGEMGKTVATNESINRLECALEDTNVSVRISACKALGLMGEKAATDHIIHKLLNALEDPEYFVRRGAYITLGKMGDKAATNMMINRFMSALDDIDGIVRKSACKTLGGMGDIAVTDESIKRLAIALGDINVDVRISACIALGKMGEKAGTNEVVHKLANALSDTNEGVRKSACKALGAMGEKAVTNESINRLTNALVDMNVYVRISACEALGEMGKKAATNDVINGLVSALGDTEHIVRREAYKTLGKMGENATTNEITIRLMSALTDADDFVRRSACTALGELGGKVATNESIDRLASALADINVDVRTSACTALCKMGGRAATNEIINRLGSALDDMDDIVRISACQALGAMGEKAVTNESINRLLNAFGDANVHVKLSACQALGDMGEKAATTESVNRLTSALGDREYFIRRGAYKTLDKMGEKAATDEVIRILLDACNDKSNDRQFEIARIIGKILSRAYSVSHFRDATVSKLLKHIENSKWFLSENMPPQIFMQAFLDTKSPLWLPIIKTVSIRNGYGITLTENTVVVYGSKEPVKLNFSNRELGQQLQNYFMNWLDKPLESVDALGSYKVPEQSA